MNLLLFVRINDVQLFKNVLPKRILLFASRVWMYMAVMRLSWEHEFPGCGLVCIEAWVYIAVCWRTGGLMHMSYGGWPKKRLGCILLHMGVVIER
jgi:hypothetical protein